MKAVIIVVFALVMFGYMWYSDMLPFNTFQKSPALTPSVENIQQISNAITPNEKQIIYYSFEDVPQIPDKQIPVSALKKAIETWEQKNPQLKFVQSKNSNIEIRWQEYASPTHTGLATCSTVLFGILTHCILDISVGAEDCSGEFIQNDENMVANILMHEIGHALGLAHTSEEGHLMYSTESPEKTFNSRGFIVPERFEELYIGQDELLQQEKEISDKIKSLQSKISREQKQYDEYYKQYQYYEGKTLSEQDYQKAQQILDKLNSQGKSVNSLIDKQNQLIEQANEIVFQLGCNPNFEITQ
ncbi:matrixin family metalloprotease [Nitrosopumilus sp. S4]